MYDVLTAGGCVVGKRGVEDDAVTIKMVSIISEAVANRASTIHNSMSYKVALY